MQDHLDQDKSVSHSPQVLLSHKPLLLLASLWRVESASVGIFAVRIQQGQPQGRRRYLCTVNPGDLMLGSPLSNSDSDQGLIAVSLDRAEVIPLTPSDLHTLGSASSTQDPLMAWILKLTQGIQDLHPTLHLRPPQTRVPPDLSPDTYLELCYQAQIQLLQILSDQEHAQIQIEHQRLFERHQLNQQVTSIAVDHLKGVIQPTSSLPSPSSDPAVVMAAKAVGQALGVEIRAPSTQADLHQLRDPIEAIARASHLRLRRVHLRGSWWRQDNGPLLAFQHVDAASPQDLDPQIPRLSPVALLPVSVGRYRLYDPQTQTLSPLTPARAQDLDPTAYLFYRPLPSERVSAGSLIRFALQGHGRDIRTLLIPGLIIALLGMITPQVTGILVDVAIPDRDRGLVWQLGLGLGAAAFGSALFRLSQGLALTRMETGVESRLQTGIWDRILRLPPQFFRHYTIGDLLQRASSPGQIRQLLASTSLLTLLSSGFSVLYLGLLAYYSLTLASLALGVTLLILIATLLSGRLLLPQSRSLLALQGQLSSLMVELINGVTKLQIAGAEPRAFGYWATHYTEQIRYRLNRQIIQDALITFNTILPTLTPALVFVVTVTLLDSASDSGPRFTTGDFLAFNSALGIFLQGSTSLSTSLISILELIPLWERLHPILHSQPEVSDQKVEPGLLKGQIELEQVSFRYHNTGPLTLEGISLRAEPGEFIAIVGPSGSGKSTLFRLILGFEIPHQGRIRLDGRDLAGLDLEAVRQQIGVVLQQSQIPAGSLHEIVAGGALVTPDQVWEALALAGLAEDVQALPMGIHTMLGQGAPTLSGGQRQRLLIARALVLKPQILLLDEATSSLDNRTQSLIRENLSQLQSTRIVIAHRLSTIQEADRIYVLEKGQLVQEGQFDHLAQTPGLFQTLISRQIA